MTYLCVLLLDYEAHGDEKKYGHGCPVRHTLDVIGGKWKLPIVSQLSQGTRRFTEMERALTGISARMLMK